MKKRITSTPVIAGAIAVALAVTMSTPAFAADDHDGVVADAVAEQIAQVAPSASVVTGLTKEEAFNVSAQNTAVSVPLTLPDFVDVTAEVDGRDQRQTIRTAITLPEGFVSAEGTIGADGTVVYADAGASPASRDAIAVQTLADGSTRVQTVLASPTSAHEFGYELDGFTPVQDGEGNFGFLNGDGILVPVASPWAKDANGADVATRYEIRGDRLVQVVTPSASTAYPIVADPTWAWWNAGYGAKLNRDETRDVANGGGNAGICALGLFANPALAGVCGALAGYLVGQAGIANGAGECVVIIVAPAPSVWRYNDGDCY
ncbi:hypothetical protein J2Y69_000604 [Microbacterium resistens]|uniref:Uncharacterized protein n=1 Tax=Microbacterium resistens TaxID=156977 RepID=A0ABU1S8V4_9MICO|nr:hypothetical protein [Microbacterium resistens]MDR6866019.1 hypothetical protein [Microbacterium resistens]